MTNKQLLCEYSEIVKSASHLLHHIQIFEDPFIFMIDGKVVIIGELEMWNKGKTVYIKNINSLEYRKGYAKAFIRFLIQELGVKEITGESVPEAVPFWHKMKAKFQPNLFEQYLNAYDEELSGLLIPFTISA